jgi:hypothetical protein
VKRFFTTPTYPVITPFLLLFGPGFSQTAAFNYKANFLFGDPYLLQQATKMQTNTSLESELQGGEHGVHKVWID